ncbi:MAG: hypothetical protein CMJ89_14455 [Planctomycetes bacterium]|jgi:DNA-directed RNA polymerase subunit RPC12/RpoP|nr:hypothetical protein [Planctomycetota bacterium]
MDYRLGKCSQCGAEYKIPASFEHDVARCKRCSGVVNVGAVRSDDGPTAKEVTPTPPEAPAAEPMPAKKVVPATPEPSPGKSSGEPEEISSAGADEKRRERGTLAKLKAQRAAQAASMSPRAPAPRPAPVKRPAATPAKPSAKAPADRERGEGVKATGRSSRRSGSRRNARTATAAKRGFPVGGAIGVGSLLILAVVVLLFKDSFFGGSESADTGHEVAAAETPVETVEEVIEEEAPEEEPDEPGLEEKEPEEEKKPVVRDASEIDLDALPELKRARGTTDEEWAEMAELVETWMDLDAGARGPRAGRSLGEYSRKAMPVILNSWKTFDYGTPEGHRRGDMCQKMLKDICNGTNFGWRYEQDENHEWFNKKVVVAWSGVWVKVEENIVAWVNLAKLDTKDPKLAKELIAQYGDGWDDDFGGDSEELDDLDVD